MPMAMNEQQKTHKSKLLSLVLRHQPEIIGLNLDANGWAIIDELLLKLSEHGKAITRTELDEIVATNNKKRFAFNDDTTKIRANQGHSMSVDLNLLRQKPPEILFHGTIEKSLHRIMQSGLERMSRQHVHLSADMETAIKVGSRRGKPVVLMIKSGLMHQDGIPFYLSENGVWLTDAVPVKYIVV